MPAGERGCDERAQNENYQQSYENIFHDASLRITWLFHEHPETGYEIRCVQQPTC